jgi:hypothetical protein
MRTGQEVNQMERRMRAGATQADRMDRMIQSPQPSKVVNQMEWRRVPEKFGKGQACLLFCHDDSPLLQMTKGALGL